MSGTNVAIKHVCRVGIGLMLGWVSKQVSFPADFWAQLVVYFV